VDEKSRRLPLAPEGDRSETLRPDCAYNAMFQKPADRGPSLPIGGVASSPEAIGLLTTSKNMILGFSSKSQRLRGVHRKKPSRAAILPD
jgi:hypothetical protein